MSVSSSKATLADRIVKAIKTVVGPGPVSLHEPRFAGNEWLYLKDCLDSNYVSSVGKYVDRFEAELADYTGARYAVAVVNGTAALHVALRLVGVQPGDEVLIPALTFVGTVNPVSYCGAIPHFVDSEERTLGIDPLALGEYLHQIAEVRDDCCINRLTGRVIRSVVPVHVFGHPGDMDRLQDLAREFHLAVVEDAAEALGSTLRGRHAGTIAEIGTLSFNGNKTVTTGGGGALLTNNARLAAFAKHLTTTAKVSHRWEYRHDEIGYNYRMPNINAALGCAQLEELPGFLTAKRRLFDLYRGVLADLPEVRLLAEPAGCRSNYWLQTLVLSESDADQRDHILAVTNDAGLMTRPAWVLMHRLRQYWECPRMSLTVAESLERRLINLPSSALLSVGK